MVVSKTRSGRKNYASSRKLKVFKSVEIKVTLIRPLQQNRNEDVAKVGPTRSTFLSGTKENSTQVWLLNNETNDVKHFIFISYTVGIGHLLEKAFDLELTLFRNLTRFPRQESANPFSSQIFGRFEFNRLVQPIAIAKPTDVARGQAIMCGWGQIVKSPQRQTSKKLLKISLEVSTHEMCMDYWKKYNPNYNICLTSPVFSGTCNGDSGGPAVINNTLFGNMPFTVLMSVLKLSVILF